MITNYKTLSQQEVTKRVASYLAQGYMIRLGDSSQGYLARVELELPGSDTYVAIVAEETSLDHELVADTFIYSLKQQLEIKELVKTSTFEVEETKNKSVYYYVDRRETMVTDDIHIALASNQTRVDRYPSSQNQRIINAPQSKLKALVKGVTGFGKRTITKDTLSLVRKTNGYVITSSLTDGKVVIEF